MKRKASFPDQRDAGQFGLIALVGAGDTDAHILCVEKHLTGWRKIVLIENKFALRVCPGTSKGITEFSEHEAD
jgi:hypothetical protein